MARRHASWIVVVFLLLAQPILAGKRGMSVEDSLSIKGVSNLQWSSDGSEVLFTLREWQRDDNRFVSQVHKVSRGGGDTIQLTRGEKGVRSPRISPDGRHLAFLANRDQEKKGAQIWLLPLAGGESYRLTEAENGVSGFAWSPDSRRIAFTTRDVPSDKEEREKKKKDKFDAIVVDRDLAWTHLWVIRLGGEDPSRLTEGHFNASDPRWSPDGESLVFQAAYTGAQASAWKHIDDNRDSDIFRISAQGGETENLTPEPGSASGARWSPDGQRVSFTASRDAGFTAKTDLMILELAGPTTKNLTQELSYSIRGAPVWESADSLIFMESSGLYSYLARIPLSGGKPQRIEHPLGVSRGGFEIAPDGLSILYTDNDPGHPSDIWVSDSNGGRPTRITDLNPQVRELAIAESRSIRWKAPDGMEIEGVLVLPLDHQPGRRYPLVLGIHGGPTGRHTHSFNNRRSQIWAANGYAVLQPNPRGSTGYGHAFTQKNKGDWGGKDFHFDDMSGVDRVIEMGIADPEKLVVMGGSYGGFSTFWAITQTDRFKAAIGHAAISDWYSFYGQTDIPQYLKWGFEGHAWDNPETYRKYSPFDHVKKVTTPLMITHGEQDRRVPIAQAEQYYTALKKRGVETEFVRYPREGHGIREPNHVIDLVGRQLEWFDRHLGIVRETEAMEEPVTEGR